MMQSLLFFGACTARDGGIILEANWQPGWFLLSHLSLKRFNTIKYLGFFSHLAECFLTSLCLYNPRNHLKRDPSLRVRLAEEIQVNALWNGLWAVNIRGFVCPLSALPVTDWSTRTISVAHSLIIFGWKQMSDFILQSQSVKMTVVN